MEFTINMRVTYLTLAFWLSTCQLFAPTVLVVRGFVPKYRNIILAFHACGPSSIPTGNIFFSKLERRQTGRLRKRDNSLRRGGEGKGRPQDSLVLYKSFNALSYLSIYRYEQALQMPQKQFSYCLQLESGAYAANSQPVFQKLKILE